MKIKGLWWLCLIIIIFWAVLLAWLFPCKAMADTIHGGICSLVINDDVDREYIYKRVFAPSADLLLSGKPERPYSDTNLVTAFDFICLKAQRILGVYPDIKIDIKIYKTKKELNEAIKSISGQDRNLKACYVHAYKTIYTSQQTISYGVIAHEFGHVVSEHHYKDLTPSMQEQMAQEVEKRIYD